MLSAAALTSEGPPESLAAAERSSPPPPERDSAVLTSSIRMPFSRWMYLAVGKKEENIRGVKTQYWHKTRRGIVKATPVVKYVSGGEGEGRP